MSGCKIGWIKPKNGGAKVRVIETPYRSKRTFTEPCGTLKVTIEDTSGAPLDFGHCSFALDAAKVDLWQQMGRYEDDF